MTTLASHVVPPVGCPSSTTPASVVVICILPGKENLGHAGALWRKRDREVLRRHSLPAPFRVAAAWTSLRSGRVAKNPTLSASPMPPEVLRNFLGIGMPCEGAPIQQDSLLHLALSPSLWPKSPGGCAAHHRSDVALRSPSREVLPPRLSTLKTHTKTMQNVQVPS